MGIDTLLVSWQAKIFGEVQIRVIEIYLILGKLIEVVNDMCYNTPCISVVYNDFKKFVIDRIIYNVHGDIVLYGKEYL